MKDDKVKEGVCDAMDFWLGQHPITMHDILSEAAEKAISKWLDENEEVVLDIIAEAFSKHQPKKKGE